MDKWGWIPIGFATGGGKVIEEKLGQVMLVKRGCGGKPCMTSERLALPPTHLRAMVLPTSRQRNQSGARP